MDIEEQPDCTIVHCGKKIDTETVVDQLAHLQGALQLGKPIHINAEPLAKIDTAGIQLLLNFCRAADSQEISWKWQAISPALLDTAMLLGAAHLLRIKKQEIP